MPKLYVAFRGEKRKKVPKRLASGSMTTLKGRMRDYPDMNWSVATYNFKPSVENIITIVENLGKLEAESVVNFEVNANGRVRQKG